MNSLSNFNFFLIIFQIISINLKYIESLLNTDIIITGSYELNGTFVIGENITFLCYANGTIDKDTSVKWKDISAIPKPKLTIGVNSIKSEFFIHNITKKYEKKYICNITEGNKNIIISKSLNLDDPPPNYLRIFSKTNKKIIIEEGETIELEATAEGFPTPIQKKFVWTSFRMPNLITTQFETNNTKSNVLDKYWHYNANLSNSGFYTFHAENDFVKEKTTFEVYVKGLNIIKLRGYEYIKFNKTIQVNCFAASYPKITKFSWSIAPCIWPNEPEVKCVDNNNNFQLNYDPKPRISERVMYSNTLNLTLINNLTTLNKFNFGILQCSAYNEFTSKTSTMHFNIKQTDVVPFLAYFNEKKLNDMFFNEVVEIGDTFTITCIAPKVEYKEKIEWCKGLENREDCIPINLKNKNVTNTSTNLTYRSSLTFTKVEMEDHGFYLCLFWPITEYGKNFSLPFPVLSLKTISKPITPKWLFELTFAISLLLIIVLIILAHFYRKYYNIRKNLKELGLDNFAKGKPDCINPDMTINEQADLLPYNTNYEVPRKNIKLGKLLGQGAYGSVYMASISTNNKPNLFCFNFKKNEKAKIVAIKMIKENAEPRILQALGSELKIMQHIGKCSYVINLLGAVTKTMHKCELMLIVEYCKHGSLDNFLLNNRNSFQNQINYETNQINLENIDRSEPIETNIIYKKFLTRKRKNLQSENVRNSKLQQEESKDIMFNTTDLVIWSNQIASGMNHLASLKIVHGDLAARNILLSEDFEIKISDFGLAKQMYQDEDYKELSKKQLLPVMWYAIEAIEDRKLTTETDVWSYGVVLWELFSLGRKPYSEFEYIDWDFVKKIKNGYRLEQPRYTNQTIYNIMLSCWNINPYERPNFYKLFEIFNNYLGD